MGNYRERIKKARRKRFIGYVGGVLGILILIFGISVAIEAYKEKKLAEWHYYNEFPEDFFDRASTVK